MSFRARLRPLKRLAHRVLERIWSCGFALAGRLGRAELRLWNSQGGARVLVVAPHPDDEAMGCAGTIVLHVRAGDEICVCVATDGRRSRAVADSQRMAAVRHREAAAAARLMGIDRLAWLGLPEGECTAADVAWLLIPLLRQMQPDIIYAPSRIDFHPEHLKVAHGLALAIARCGLGRQPTIRIYPVQVPLACVCNLVNEVSDVERESGQISAAYASQAAVVQGALRRRRYGALLHGLGESVEEFWEVSSGQYVALHSAPPRDWPPAFRGLRNFALSDPLAYLVGRAERRRLRALA